MKRKEFVVANPERLLEYILVNADGIIIDNLFVDPLQAPYPAEIAKAHWDHRPEGSAIFIKVREE